MIAHKTLFYTICEIFFLITGSSCDLTISEIREICVKFYYCTTSLLKPHAPLPDHLHKIILTDNFYRQVLCFF